MLNEKFVVERVRRKLCGYVNILIYSLQTLRKTIKNSHFNNMSNFSLYHTIYEIHQTLLKGLPDPEKKGARHWKLNNLSRCKR